MHAEREKKEEREKEREETKMSGLCREEPVGEGQLSPCTGKFRVVGRECQEMMLRDAGRTWRPSLL